MSKLHLQFLYTEIQLKQNSKLSTWAPRPKLPTGYHPPFAGLQQHRIRLWGDVSFKLRGQEGGKPRDGGVGVVHDGRRSVRAGNLWDHVPRRHPLEVHNVVRRGHGEGSQDTEAEGALGVLGDPAT